MVKKNACIFISGRGTNLKNLILKTRDYNFPITIKLGDYACHTINLKN